MSDRENLNYLFVDFSLTTSEEIGPPAEGESTQASTIMAADPREVSALRQHISSLPENSVLRRKVSAAIDEMTAAPPDTEFVRIIHDAQLPTQPRGSGDLLALAVHCLLVKKHGFVATGKEPVPGSSAVPGFAPPLRVQDISESKLAPSSWQSGGGANDDGNCVFTYRDGARRPYSMRAIRVASTLVVHFGAAPRSASASQAIDASDVSSAELDIEKYLDTDSVAATSSCWLDPGALDAAVTAALFSSGSPASSSASTAPATSKHAAPTTRSSSSSSSSSAAAAANSPASQPASRPLPRSIHPPRPMPAVAPPRFQPPVSHESPPQVAYASKS